MLVANWQVTHDFRDGWNCPVNNRHEASFVIIGLHKEDYRYEVPVDIKDLDKFDYSNAADTAIEKLRKVV